MWYLPMRVSIQVLVFLTPEGERDPDGQIDAMPESQWDRVIAVNLTGVFMTIRKPRCFEDDGHDYVDRAG